MANTLKFGNGEWYGKKDTILAYNDLNSNYKPLPFNFSRASKATVINKDGLIEEVGSGQPRIDYLNNTKGALKLEPSRTNLITYSSDFPNFYWTKSGATIQADPSTAGSELVTNGDFATDSDWALVNNTGTDTEIASGYLRIETDGAYTQVSQDAALTSGKQYKLVYTILNSDNGNLGLITNGNQTLLIPSSVGTHIHYFTADSSSIVLKRYSGALNVQIDNISVKEVQGFTSPDGTNNAYKLVEGTNNGNHSISATVLVNSGDNSFSMYVKENGRKHISLYTNSRGSENDQYGFYLNGSGSVTFNNTNGDATITSLSNGWYRVSITHPSSGYNTRFFKLYLSNSEVSSNTIPSYQGDGLKGVYIYGSQVEAGSYSTSAIFTSGSAVTRSADACNNGANEQVINSTEGVLYAEIKGFISQDTIEQNRYITITNGTSNERVALLLGGNPNQLRSIIYSSAQSINLSFTTSLTDVKQYNKLAVKYKSGDYAFFLNGVKIGSSTITNAFSENTLNDLSFDVGGGTQQFRGIVKDLKLYNTALTDQELIALTS